MGRKNRRRKHHAKNNYQTQQNQTPHQQKNSTDSSRHSGNRGNTSSHKIKTHFFKKKNATQEQVRTIAVEVFGDLRYQVSDSDEYLYKN